MPGAARCVVAEREWSRQDLAATASEGSAAVDQVARGSIVAVTNAAGTVTNINKYDAYGQPDENNEGRFQFTGQMWLSEAGLYHFKARAYHPGLGRFMQTDPIGVKGGMNLYAYCGNDPVNCADPSGEDFWAAFFIAALINSAIQLITTGEVDLGQAALSGVVAGIFDVTIGSSLSAGSSEKLTRLAFLEPEEIIITGRRICGLRCDIAVQVAAQVPTVTAALPTIWEQAEYIAHMRPTEMEAVIKNPSCWAGPGLPPGFVHSRIMEHFFGGPTYLTPQNLRQAVETNAAISQSTGVITGLMGGASFGAGAAGLNPSALPLWHRAAVAVSPASLYAGGVATLVAAIPTIANGITPLPSCT